MGKIVAKTVGERLGKSLLEGPIAGGNKRMHMKMVNNQSKTL